MDSEFSTCFTGKRHFESRIPEESKAIPLNFETAEDPNRQTDYASIITKAVIENYSKNSQNFDSLLKLHNSRPLGPAHFTATFSIYYTKKSSTRFDKKIKNIYHPISQVTTIGCSPQILKSSLIVKSDVPDFFKVFQTNKTDIELYSKNQVSLQIVQYKDCAIVCEKKDSEKIGAMFEILTQTEVLEGDIFRIDKTTMVFEVLSSRSLKVNKNISKGGEKIEDLEINDCFLIGRYLGEIKIYVRPPDGFESISRVARDAYKWTMEVIDTTTVWKYFSTKSSLSSQGSPKYDIQLGQKIRLGGHLIWLVSK